MGRTPSDVLHALVHLFIDDPVNVSIHLEKHLAKVDKEKEEKPRKRKRKREYEIPDVKKYIQDVDPFL